MLGGIAVLPVLPVPPVSRAAAERRLLEQLRAGDESAFAGLVAELTPTLLRVARGYVPSRAIAEEVVQETWLGIIKGLDTFEGRASLRSWAFCILLNQARTRGTREQRTVPFAAVGGGQDDDRGDVLDWGRWPAHWATPPRRRCESPEGALEDAEALDVVRTTIALLPSLQRHTIVMRDLEGWPARDVCDALGVTQGNQRVLLHRARARVRAALVERLA